jgi:hypothetical protein
MLNTKEPTRNLDDRTTTKAKARPRRYVQVNKNFTNFPLARDRRSRVDWHRSPQRRYWWCYLPGTKRVILRLPSTLNHTHRRCPTAFDMGVLSVLLREEQLTKNTTVVFAHDQLIRAATDAKIKIGKRHRRDLEAALTLWSKLRITFTRWYDSNQNHKQNGQWVRVRKGRGHIKRTLPAAIESFIVHKDGTIGIALSRTWVQLFKRHFAQVTLPFPHQPHVQNLVLWLRGWEKKGSRRDYSKTIALRKLTRIIGVNHRNRNEVLQQAIESAQVWLRRYTGIVLDHCTNLMGRNTIMFMLEPRIAPVKSEPAIANGIARVPLVQRDTRNAPGSTQEHASRSKPSVRKPAPSKANGSASVQYARRVMTHNELGSRTEKFELEDTGDLVLRLPEGVIERKY